MTPAQLGSLIDVHNALQEPGGKHARTHREYDDPAALVGLSQMRRG